MSQADGTGHDAGHDAGLNAGTQPPNAGGAADDNGKTIIDSIVGQATAAIAIFAAMVYGAGVLTLGLKLGFLRLPWEAVLGQLPHDFILVTALGQVILPCLLGGCVIAGVVDGLHKQHNRDLSWITPSRYKWLVLAWALLAGAVLGAIPLALLHFTRHSAKSELPDNLFLGGGWIYLICGLFSAITFALATYLILKLYSHNLNNALRLSLAVVTLSAALIPSVASVSASFLLPPVVLCAPDFQHPGKAANSELPGWMDGNLIGNNSQFAYIAQFQFNRSRTAITHRTITVVPLPEIRIEGIGPHSGCGDLREPVSAATVSAATVSAATVSAATVSAALMSAAPAACPPAGAIAYVGPTATVGGQETITGINTVTNTAGPKIRAGRRPGPFAVTPNGKMIYVVNVVAGTVTPISACTAAARPQIKVGRSPAGVAITPDGKTAYVINARSDSVTPIRIATNTALAPISVGIRPEAIVITPNGRTAYVANAESNSVTPIRIATNTALAPITVGRHPDLLIISRDGKTVYIGNGGGTFVSRISTATNQALAPIRVGFAAAALAISPHGTTGYAASWTDFELVKINLVTGVALPPIGLDGPDALAFTPDGKTLYVADHWGNGARAINVSTDTVIARISTGNLSNAVAISPNGKTAYVLNNVWGTVTPITTATNKTSRNISVGGQPVYLVMAP